MSLSKFFLFFVTLYGFNKPFVSDEVSLNMNSSNFVLEEVAGKDSYISENFGLKIDYTYIPPENTYIFEDKNKISILSLLENQDFLDIDACNHDYSDTCLEVDGKSYRLLETMEVINIDEDLNLKDNLNQLLLDREKNLEECSIKILDKESWAITDDLNGSLRIYFSYLEEKQNEISSLKDPLLQVRAYKGLISSEEEELMNILSVVEEALQAGDDDLYVEMYMSNSFWGPLSQKHCGVFEGQFLTNWKPGHLVYFSEKPNILIPMQGLSGGSGPILGDAELVN